MLVLGPHTHAYIRTYARTHTKTHIYETHIYTNYAIYIYIPTDRDTDTLAYFNMC